MISLPRDVGKQRADDSPGRAPKVEPRKPPVTTRGEGGRRQYPLPAAGRGNDASHKARNKPAPGKSDAEALLQKLALKEDGRSHVTHRV